MRKGYLALVLHAHLPFVRHPEYPEFLEEDWLFEAITETYVPLWQVFEGLLRDNVPFRLTMSLTPPLCAMLNDDLLRERYLRYLDRAIGLAKREIERTQAQPEINHLARIYYSRFLECREIYVDRLQCDGHLVVCLADVKEAVGLGHAKANGDQVCMLGALYQLS